MKETAALIAVLLVGMALGFAAGFVTSNYEWIIDVILYRDLPQC